MVGDVHNGFAHPGDNGNVSITREDFHVGAKISGHINDCIVFAGDVHNCAVNAGNGNHIRP